MAEDVTISWQDLLCSLGTAAFVLFGCGNLPVSASSNSLRRYSFGVILRGAISAPEEYNQDGNMPN